MTPDEIIMSLEKLNVKISRSTLLRYEKAGLIPEPERGGMGRGKGRTTSYSIRTIGEAYAAYCLIHKTYSFSPNQVKKIRESAIRFLDSFFSEIIIELNQKMTHEQLFDGHLTFIYIDSLIFEWIVNKYKALSNNVNYDVVSVIINGDTVSDTNEIVVIPNGGNKSDEILDRYGISLVIDKSTIFFKASGVGGYIVCKPAAEKYYL